METLKIILSCLDTLLAIIPSASSSATSKSIQFPTLWQNTLIRVFESHQNQGVDSTRSKEENQRNPLFLFLQLDGASWWWPVVEANENVREFEYSQSTDPPTMQVARDIICAASRFWASIPPIMSNSLLNPVGSVLVFPKDVDQTLNGVSIDSSNESIIGMITTALEQWYESASLLLSHIQAAVQEVPNRAVISISRDQKPITPRDSLFDPKREPSNILEVLCQSSQSKRHPSYDNPFNASPIYSSENENETKQILGDEKGAVKSKYGAALIQAYVLFQAEYADWAKKQLTTQNRFEPSDLEVDQLLGQLWSSSDATWSSIKQRLIQKAMNSPESPEQNRRLHFKSLSEVSLHIVNHNQREHTASIQESSDVCNQQTDTHDIVETEDLTLPIETPSFSPIRVLGIPSERLSDSALANLLGFTTQSTNEIYERGALQWSNATLQDLASVIP